MIPSTKAGGKFTIETTIRDKDGNIKEHTIEEGVTEEAEEKAEEKGEGVEKLECLGDKTPTAIAEFSIKTGRELPYCISEILTGKRGKAKRKKDKII